MSKVAKVIGISAAVLSIVAAFIYYINTNTFKDMHIGNGYIATEKDLLDDTVFVVNLRLDSDLFDKLKQLAPQLYYSDCHSAGYLYLGNMSQYHERSGTAVNVRFEIISPGTGTVGNSFSNEELEILHNPIENLKCAYIKTDHNLSRSVYVSNIFRIYKD